MPLRMLLRYLANNEHLVQKIAESYPMRRAAQICVSIFYRTKYIAKDNIPTDKIDSIKFASFFNRFKQNFSEGMKDVRNQIKDNDKKIK